MHSEDPLSSPLSSDDAVGTVIGKTGVFQTLMILYATLAAMVTAMNNFMPVTAAHTVNHWCAPPEGYEDMDVETWKNMSIPVREDGTYSECEMYEEPLNVSEGNRSIVPCMRWQYDNSEHYGTIVEQWDLVCDRAWLVPASTAAYMLGTFAGFIFSGALSDSIGRKPVAIVSSTSAVLSCVSLVNAWTLMTFIILRFFVGSSVSAVAVSVYVLYIEVTSAENRGFYGVLMFCAYSTGVMIMRISYHFNAGWRLYQLVVAVPTSLLLVPFLWVQESPRWLISRWELAKAERVILIIGRINGSRPEDTLEAWYRVRAKLETEQEKYSGLFRVKIFNVFFSPELRSANLILFYAWFAASLTYYGIHAHLEAAPDTALVVTAATLLPVALLTYFGIERLGRRPTLTYAMFLTSISCAIQSFLGDYDDGHIIQTVADTIGLVGISIANTVSVLSICEVNPTSVRTIAGCCGFICSRTGMILASLTQDAGKSRTSILPLLLCAVSCCIAGFLVTFIPETRCARLPEAYKKQDIFEIAPLHIRTPPMTSAATRFVDSVLHISRPHAGALSDSSSVSSFSDEPLDVRSVIQRSSDTQTSAL